MRGAAGKIAVVIVGSAMLAACSSSQAPLTQLSKQTKEYFSQAEYGKASPVKVASNAPVPKGGGRYSVGKPYRVAGKTYVPKDDPDYSATGYASWYGSAFHGRQTANGEIYDMHDLTAAHPTLPLPSYVRVTNLENGRSVVVRVNDRGPFAHNRIIDVSKTAAGMLGFEKQGTAKVRVDYVGRAELHGRDRNMLLATYTERGKPARASKGLFGFGQPRGTMQVASAAPAPRLRTAHSNDATLREPMAIVPAYAQPASGNDLIAPLILSGGYVTSFAEPNKPVRAQKAINTLLTKPQAQAAAQPVASSHGKVVVQLGTFGDPANALHIRDAFAGYGDVEVLPTQTDGPTYTTVRVALNDRVSADEVIAAATRAGLSGAFVLGY